MAALRRKAFEEAWLPSEDEARDVLEFALAKGLCLDVLDRVTRPAASGRRRNRRPAEPRPVGEGVGATEVSVGDWADVRSLCSGSSAEFDPDEEEERLTESHYVEEIV